MKFKNILVISDQQGKQQMALAHAKSMVERYGANLHILAFTYQNLKSPSVTLSDEQLLTVQAKVIDSHQQWLDEQINKENLQTHASTEVVWEKNIAKWVIKHCEANDYDLIIKTGHRSEGLLYVPTDWHLLRNNKVPVLLVAEKKWRKKQSILVALDLATRIKSKQALNQKLLDAGIMLAAGTQMPLHICCSVAISPVLKELGLVNKNDEVNAAKLKYLPLIDKMLGEHQVALEHIHINLGNASKVIPSVASKNGAALVIIGSIGRKGLKAKLLGNTAESVLALLKTDILIIQP
jgi:universal stress protein E